MTLADDLGVHGAAFAELADERNDWTPEQLARAICLHGYTSKTAFEAFRSGVIADLERFERTDEALYSLGADQLALERRIVSRLRRSLPLLVQMTPEFLLRELAALEADEARRQDAAERPAAARRAELRGLAAADAAANIELNGGEV